jgi:hypothetical protein
MPTLRVNDVLKDRVLVSRESARLLEDALHTTMASAGPTIDASDTAQMTVDFVGVEGVAPSFLDELLSIFESHVAVGIDGHERCLIVVNPPTRLSLKFEAVARGHGMSAQALPDGSWALTDAQSPPS